MERLISSSSWVRLARMCKRSQHPPHKIPLQLHRTTTSMAALSSSLPQLRQRESHPLALAHQLAAGLQRPQGQHSSLQRPPVGSRRRHRRSLVLPQSPALAPSLQLPVRRRSAPLNPQAAGSRRRRPCLPCSPGQLQRQVCPGTVEVQSGEDGARLAEAALAQVQSALHLGDRHLWCGEVLPAA